MDTPTTRPQALRIATAAAMTECVIVRLVLSAHDFPSSADVLRCEFNTTACGDTLEGVFDKGEHVTIDSARAHRTRHFGRYRFLGKADQGRSVRSGAGRRGRR
jgi:hypothetical protein